MTKWPTLLIAIIISLCIINIAQAIDNQLFIPCFGSDQIYSPSNSASDIQLNSYFSLYQEIEEIITGGGGGSISGSYNVDYNVSLDMKDTPIAIGDNITAVISIQNHYNNIGNKLIIFYSAIPKKSYTPEITSSIETIEVPPGKTSLHQQCSFYKGTFDPDTHDCILIIERSILIPNNTNNIGNWSFVLDYNKKPFPYSSKIKIKPFEVKHNVTRSFNLTDAFANKTDIVLDKMNDFFDAEHIDDELKDFLINLWHQMKYYYNVSIDWIVTELNISLPDEIRP
ncbi:hypothetical protein ACFL43_07615 [Thermodesulfobacteriota bacterium]